MKIRCVEHNNLERWRVTWRVAGKTKRRFFKTQTAAKTFASVAAGELKDYGAEWAAVPPHARAELIECWKAAGQKGYTISEACRFWEKSRATEPIQLGHLIDRFIKAKASKGLRSESLRLLKTTLDMFQDGRSETWVSNVTTGMVTEWMDGHSWGAWRRRGAIVDMNNLFRWALRARLASSNPLDAIERPTIEIPHPIVLSPDDCRKLLNLCNKSRHRPLLAGICIGLFAGLRTAELERLRWEDVGTSHIRLSSAQTKGRSRRIVTIHPTLAEWLDICRKPRGTVWKRNRKPAHALRAEFGKWTKNVLRHSYISYEMARSKDAQATAIEAGNSPEIIFKHYRELVTPEAAAEFWSLTPFRTLTAHGLHGP